MDSVRQILESGGDPAVLLVYAQRLVLGRTFASIGNLGTLTLATRLRRRGFNAVAYTAISSDVMKLLAGLRRKPFAVGFYCDFDNQSVVRALCSRIRAANGNAVRILIGGPQTFHMAADDVERYSADVIFRGDGENSLEAWLEAELAGQPTTLSNAMTVRNRAAGYRQENSPGDEAAPDDSLAFSADIRHRMITCP